MTGLNSLSQSLEVFPFELIDKLIEISLGFGLFKSLNLIMKNFELKEL